MASEDSRDYYAVLGILHAATPEQVDAAFRTLARQYHPDAAPDNVRAEAEFKKINDAHGVLADPEKRRRYDRTRVRQRPSGTRRSQSRDAKAVPPGDPAADDFGQYLHTAAMMDLLDTWFGPGRVAPPPATRAQARHEAALQLDLWLTPVEAAHGGPCDFWLSLPSTCPVCRGYRIVPAGACSECGGSGVVRNGERQMRVEIPPGTRNGTVLRVRAPWATGARSGDLLLRVRIRPVW